MKKLLLLIIFTTSSFGMKKSDLNAYNPAETGSNLTALTSAEQIDSDSEDPIEIARKVVQNPDDEAAILEAIEEIKTAAISAEKNLTENAEILKFAAFYLVKIIEVISKQEGSIVIKSEKIEKIKQILMKLIFEKISTTPPELSAELEKKYKKFVQFYERESRFDTKVNLLTTGYLEIEKNLRKAVENEQKNVEQLDKNLTQAMRENIENILRKILVQNNLVQMSLFFPLIEQGIQMTGNYIHNNIISMQNGKPIFFTLKTAEMWCWLFRTFVFFNSVLTINFPVNSYVVKIILGIAAFCALIFQPPF